jgi:ketosteroid isomerase-like protein
MQTVQHESLTDLTRKGTCLEFFLAYQDHDTARMIALATPDATVAFTPMGDAGAGAYAEKGIQTWAYFMDCFPDIDNTVDTLTAEGEEITCHVAIFGTQAKECVGIASQGLRFNSDHIFVFRFDTDDRITHVSISWDHASFVRQLTGA